MMVSKKEPQWYQDSESAWSDIGIDTKVWRSAHKGFEITVYPCSLINKNVKGWEYRLFHEKKTKGDDWDSWNESSNGDHAASAQQAMQWAITTINEWGDG